MIYNRLDLMQMWYTWKKYNSNATTTYYWNKYNRVSTTYYKWNRYNVSSTTTYTWKRYRYGWVEVEGTSQLYYRQEHDTMKYWTSYDPKTGGLTNEKSIYLDKDNLSAISALSNIYTPYMSYMLKLKNFLRRELTYNPQGSDYYDYVFNAVRISGEQRKIEDGTVTSTNRSAYPDAGDQDGYYYEYSTSTTTESKGSSNGTVSSTSRSAYPDDGKSGSYWYVYSTSSVSYSKGSTSYGQVSSTNRSAYPNNSYSGSYWYVYSTNITTYSQGTYIEDVTDTNETAYPDNGRYDTDGYWYVKVT